MRLFEGGADPQQFDREMVRFGMPIGPFTLLDEVGLDIAAHAARSVHEAYGDRMAPCAAIENQKGEKRLGKKTWSPNFTDEP